MTDCTSPVRPGGVAGAAAIGQHQPTGLRKRWLGLNPKPEAGNSSARWPPTMWQARTLTPRKAPQARKQQLKLRALKHQFRELLPETAAAHQSTTACKKAEALLTTHPKVQKETRNRLGKLRRKTRQQQHGGTDGRRTNRKARTKEQGMGTVAHTL